MNANIRLPVVARLGAALATGGLVACTGSPAAPRADTRDARVQVRSLQLRVAQTGAVLFAGGSPDGTAVLSPDVNLHIALSTDAGDQENVEATISTCQAPDGSDYECHSLIFGMAEGHVASEVQAAVEALGMRFTHVYTAVPGGSVVVLTGTDAAAFDALRAVPNVGVVEYSGIVHATVVLQPEVSGAVAVSNASIIAGDGVIEFQPGQTVTARYQQPDGTILTASLRM